MSSTPLMYDDYLRKVARRFENRFADINAEWSFELGVEFEITLCRVLRRVLPQRYGICRGFIVTRDGQKTGDDIIIYDRDGTPTLRLVEQEGFERKEAIPVEAAYAYIEAKHTLCIEGDGGQSISKACAQVRAAKSLPRDVVPWTFHDPYMAYVGAEASPPAGWPPSRNQLFGAILARYVRRRVGGELLQDPTAITTALTTANLGESPRPDLIVAGADVVCLPSINHGFHSPFLVEGKSHLSSCQTPGVAFGTGISSLLFALDMMRLGPMPWSLMLAEAVGLRVITDAQRGTEEITFSLPVFVVKDDAQMGIHAVGFGDRTLIAVFATAENAQRYVDTANLESATVLQVETSNDLRRLLGESARQGIDEVVLDYEFGGHEFSSVHISFLLEHLDQSTRNEPDNE